VVHAPTINPAAGPAVLPRWRTAFRALADPSYRRYFIAQIPMVVGSWIHTIALGWLMWDLSGSAWMLGMLAICEYGPSLVLAPLAGTLIDRMSRPRLLLTLLACEFAIVSLLAGLTLAGMITVPIMVVLATAIGVLAAFEIPTRQALVAEIVGPEALPSAIALNSLLFNSARLVGPAVGGFTAAWAGEGWCFVLKALSFLPPAWVVATMQLGSPEPVSRGAFLPDLRAGLDFVRRAPEAARLLVLVGAASFFSVPYFSFLPALAGEMLGHGAALAGTLMSISGAGAVAAGLLLAFDARGRLLRVLPVWAAVGLGLAILAIGLSHQLWLTALLALPTGFAILAQNLSSNTRLQQLAPRGYRGRVMSLYTMMMLGTVPIGALLAGALADHIGMARVFVLCGALCTLTALGVAWHRWRHPLSPADDPAMPVT